MKARNQGRKGIWLVGASIAVVAVGLSLGTALAHKAKYSTSVNLQLQDIGVVPPATEATMTQYSGKVNSTRAACVKFRPVTITSTTGLSLTATTNLSGDFGVVGAKQVQGVDVTVTLPRLVKKKKGHKHICLPSTHTRKAPK